MIIVVEGIIGSGKTTFMKWLGRFVQQHEHIGGRANIIIIEEPQHLWVNELGQDLLKDFYDNPSQATAMPLQEGIIEAFRRLYAEHKFRKHDWNTVIILERSIFSALHVFIKTMAQNGFLLPFDVELLTKQIKAIEMSLDMVIYLRTNPRVANDRLAQRSTIESDKITLLYQQQLCAAYDDWLMYDKTPREYFEKYLVIVLDWDKASFMDPMLLSIMFKIEHAFDDATRISSNNLELLDRITAGPKDDDQPDDDTPILQWHMDSAIFNHHPDVPLLNWRYARSSWAQTMPRIWRGVRLCEKNRAYFGIPFLSYQRYRQYLQHIEGDEILDIDDE